MVRVCEGVCRRSSGWSVYRGDESAVPPREIVKFFS